VLAHRWVCGSRASPDTGRVALFMHGILGTGRNWNSPARKVVARHPDWRILLVDHRAHGQSPSRTAPHTIDACARDVRDTLDGLLGQGSEMAEIVCGHSFGGKVALGFAALQLSEDRVPPRRTWLFDSLPGMMPGSVDDGDEGRGVQSVSFVLSRLSMVARGAPFEDRPAAEQALMKAGLAKPTALWLGTSTRPVEGGVEFVMDIKTIETLFQAYRSTDLWHVLEAGEAKVDMIRALRNTGPWTAETLDRIRGLPCSDLVELDAGHNVHVDDLPGVLKAIDSSFL